MAIEYNEMVVDHFNNPRNVGIVEDYNGYGKAGDPACGDTCEITVLIVNNIIKDIKFRVFGCVGAVVTSSATTVLAIGRDVYDALKITDDDVVAYLGGLPENKKHCSLLAVRAMHAAIDNYYRRPGEVDIEQDG